MVDGKNGFIATYRKGDDAAYFKDITDMEVLEIGKITLYKYLVPGEYLVTSYVPTSMTMGGKASRTALVFEVEGTIVLAVADLTPEDLKKTLFTEVDVLKNNPDLYFRIANDKIMFTADSVTRLVQEFNQWHEAQLVSVEK